MGKTVCPTGMVGKLTKKSSYTVNGHKSLFDVIKGGSTINCIPGNYRACIYTRIKWSDYSYMTRLSLTLS